MGDELCFAPLGSLVDPERGISYGVVQPGKHVHAGVPIVRVADIRNGRISQANPMRVSDEIAASYRRTELRGGELLLTLVGTVGETAVVPDGLRGWNTARAVAVVPVLANPGPRWVRYALQTGAAREYINARLNTTVQATLNLGDVSKLPIPMPPLAVREGILEAVGTLDDKIELNRRTNETLEEIARTLFKSWFVDFDPVRAKAEGRQPAGMDAETAALFPSEFEESELGQIPKGWFPTAWGELVSLEYGKGIRTYEKSKGRYPVFGTNGQIGWHSDYLCEGPGVIIGRKGAYRGIHFSEQHFFVIDTAYFARARVPLSWRWAFYEMRRIDLDDMDSGSAIPSTSREEFYRLGVCVPPFAVQMAFENLVSFAFALISVNKSSSDTLADTRDLLLPRLLSGEIDLRQAEHLVESAT